MNIILDLKKITEFSSLLLVLVDKKNPSTEPVLYYKSKYLYEDEKVPTSQIKNLDEIVLSEKFKTQILEPVSYYLPALEKLRKQVKSKEAKELLDSEILKQKILEI